jgi:hypothetical protein
LSKAGLSAYEIYQDVDLDRGELDIRTFLLFLVLHFGIFIFERLGWVKVAIRQRGWLRR